MRKGCFALVVFLSFMTQGNLYANEEAKDREYSKIEINLVDFSKKITAYYEKQNFPIPEDFDENKFFEVLKKTYPNQSKIELIQGNFKIKVRATGNNNYSVVLCDLDTDNKLMEDFSCGIKNVEIRNWDKEGRFTCTFEENWEAYCR